MNIMILNIPKQEKDRNIVPIKYNDYILSTKKKQTQHIISNENFYETTETIKKQAKEVYEHFAVVEESRKTIKKGDIIPWNEYTKKFKIKKNNT